MDFGSIAQWIGLLVTLLVFTLGACFGFVRWQITHVYSTIEGVKTERNRLLENHRSEAFAQAARAEAAAARATTDVARLELKMTERFAEIREQLRRDMETIIDRHFSQFYLRIDTLEKKWERYVDVKVRAP